MKVHFEPNQHYIYNNFAAQKNNNRDIAFKSFVYDPKSIINQRDPVAKYLFRFFDKAVLVSRITWTSIRPSLKNHVKEIEVKKNNENIVRLWDINKNDRKKYVVIMHGFCHNISSLQELYENVLNKTKYGILAQEYSGLRECDSNQVKMSPKSLLEDSEIGIKYLTDKGIKNEDIIVLGHSFGGFVASQLASKEKDLGGLIMVSATDSLKPVADNIKSGRDTLVSEKISQIIKRFRIYTWYMSKMYKTSDNLKKVKAPVDIIHSEHDRYVVMDSANALVKSCKNLNSLNILQRGFHKMDNEKINAIVTLLNQKSSY